MQYLRAALPASLRNLPTRQTQRVIHGHPLSTLSASNATIFKPSISSVPILQAPALPQLSTRAQFNPPSSITSSSSYRPKLGSRTFLSSRYYLFAKQKHVFDCLVQDEVGALGTMVPVLSNKGFNIESLAIGKSEFKGVSRMTIVLKGVEIPDEELSVAVEEVLIDLRNLPSVWTAEGYVDTHEGLIGDELLLVEVSVLGAETVKQIHVGLEDAMRVDASPDKEARLVAFINDLHFVPVEKLRENQQTLTRLTERYGGKVLHANVNTCVAELSGPPEEIDEFLEVVAPYGIVQCSRTQIALPRWPFLQSTRRYERKKRGLDTVDDVVIPYE